MFFSQKEFIAAVNAGTVYFGTGARRKPVYLRSYVRQCKQAILDRQTGFNDTDGTYFGVGKWYRPWFVVPKLRDFAPPEGDYGIGVEIELGFNTLEDAKFVANKVKNWRHIALDWEGPSHPIEATFPPFLYSKMDNNKQPFRYLKLLADNEDKVYKHAANSYTGTHINVSKGGVTFDHDRVNDMYVALGRFCNMADASTKVKYFGRNPYGFCDARNGFKFIEYKLFNSTTDRKALRRYINIAVAITDLIASDTPINQDSLLAALEAGYNKR